MGARSSDEVIMASVNGVNEDKPVLDMSALTWGDIEDNSILFAQATKAEREGDIEEMRRCFREMRAVMAKVVKYVPSSWLGAGAPEKPDWSDPDTFRFLRKAKFQELRKLTQEDGESPLET